MAGWCGAGGAAAAMLLLLLLAGCGGGGDDTVPAQAVPDTPAASTAPVAAAASAVGGRDPFMGMWTGPEGLSFVVERRPGGGYHVRNQDRLDDRTAFAAVADGGVLRFVRRGQPLAARPGAGAETGFKWLANKRDCLIVQTDVEGYCRD